LVLVAQWVTTEAQLRKLEEQLLSIMERQHLQHLVAVAVAAGALLVVLGEQQALLVHLVLQQQVRTEEPEHLIAQPLWEILDQMDRHPVLLVHPLITEVAVAVAPTQVAMIYQFPPAD
jgi:CRISPR/Cas system CMR subunit Cmr4 (Cas7 group RAMP superfamily)